MTTQVEIYQQRMRKRLERAKRRYDQIRARADSANGDERADITQLIEDEFSAFIQELKIVQYYFGELWRGRGNKNPNRRLDEWRDQLSPPVMQTVWDQIRALRDFDVHREPIAANHQPPALLARDGKLLVTSDGRLMLREGGYFADCQIRGQTVSVRLDDFCPAALALTEAFISEFDQPATEPQIDPERYAAEFAQLGLDYYVAARAAARCGLMIVTANLLHHAVEMVLKSRLARELSPYQLQDDYGHNLNAIWSAYKAKLGGTLSGFDSIVRELHKFEHIRYPDNLIRHGARIEIGFGQPCSAQNIGRPEPEYRLWIADVDRLFTEAFRRNWNRPGFWIPAQAQPVIEHLNPEADYWFPKA